MNIILQHNNPTIYIIFFFLYTKKQKTKQKTKNKKRNNKYLLFPLVIYDLYVLSSGINLNPKSVL
jgi:hypothetical protein